MCCSRSGGDYSFGPDARLKKRPEFRRVYDEGRRVGGRYFLCFFKEARRGGSSPAGAQASRIGITVTRKVGNAVCRNRLRRVVREFFRHRRSDARPGVDIVVNARSSAAGEETRALWDDLESVLQRAGVLARKEKPHDETSRFPAQ